MCNCYFKCFYDIVNVLQGVLVIKEFIMTQRCSICPAGLLVLAVNKYQDLQGLDISKK